MVTFKQFLLETVIHDASPDDLKALIHNDSYNKCRFLVHPDSSMSITDETHGQAVKGGKWGEHYRNGSLFGYASHVKGRYHYAAYNHSTEEVVNDHPILKKLEQHGFKQGKLYLHTGVEPAKKGDDLSIPIDESINEELEPKIYRGIHPNTLIALAKRHGSMRFVIDPQDRIHAGGVHDFIHSHLFPPGIRRYDMKAARGVITHNKNTGETYFANDGRQYHPHFDALEKKGCVKGKVVGDWGEIRAVDHDDDSDEHQTTSFTRSSTSSSISSTKTPTPTPSTPAPTPTPSGLFQAWQKTKSKTKSLSNPDQMSLDFNKKKPFKNTFTSLFATKKVNEAKVTINGLKGIAKKSGSHLARFVALDDKLYGGDARDVFHYQLKQEDSGYPQNDDKFKTGFVRHYPETNEYKQYSHTSGSHPMTDKMESLYKIKKLEKGANTYKFIGGDDMDVKL